MSGDTNARNHRRLVDRDFHLHSLSSAIECGSGTGHPGGGGMEERASQASADHPSLERPLWWCNAFAVTVIRVTDGTGIRDHHRLF